MSSSLNVVSMALVFCASLSLWAIFILILFILTLCSDRVPAISVVGSAGGMRTTGEEPGPAEPEDRQLLVNRLRLIVDQQQCTFGPAEKFGSFIERKKKNMR